MLLAMGATRMEATRDVVQRASRMALTPLLNTMNVVVRLLVPLWFAAGWGSCYILHDRVALQQHGACKARGHLVWGCLLASLSLLFPLCVRHSLGASSAAPCMQGIVSIPGMMTGQVSRKLGC
jgi:hypothetical protein